MSGRRSLAHKKNAFITFAIKTVFFTQLTSTALQHKISKSFVYKSWFFYSFEECKNSKQSVSNFLQSHIKKSQICDAAHTFLNYKISAIKI